MPCLFDVVALDVGNVPNVFDILPYVLRVLAERIPGHEDSLRPLEVLLARVLRGDADGIQIEKVIVGLRIPKDHFIAALESTPRMQAMTKMPDDPVAHLQPVRFEYRSELDVQRDDLAVVNKIPDLPAQGAIGFKSRYDQVNDSFLPTHISFKRVLSFVGFTDVIRWGGHDKIEQRLIR